ncbi:kinetochore-associated protein DSN1 homolog [Rhinophrynus dorsalis]
METSCRAEEKKPLEITPKKSGSGGTIRPTLRKRSSPSPNVKPKVSPIARKKQRTNPNDLSLEEPVSSPQKRRSLRRSDKKKTRRSLPPIYHSTAGLCEAISLELPASERFSQLLQSCFQFSVQKLEDSLKNTDGFNSESFSAKVSLVAQKINHFTERLTRDGTLNKCTEEHDSSMSNPETEVFKEQIKEYTTKFASESQTWEQLLEEYKTKAEDLARQFDESKLTKAPSASVSHMPSSQDKVILSKPDYNKILASQGTVLDCMETVLDELQESIQLLNSFLEDTSQHLQKMSSQLKSRSFKQLEDSPVRKFLKIPQK